MCVDSCTETCLWTREWTCACPRVQACAWARAWALTVLAEDLQGVGLRAWRSSCCWRAVSPGVPVRIPESTCGPDLLDYEHLLYIQTAPYREHEWIAALRAQPFMDSSQSILQNATHDDGIREMQRLMTLRARQQCNVANLVVPGCFGCIRKTNPVERSPSSRCRDAPD